jgi:hypothetical protein
LQKLRRDNRVRYEIAQVLNNFTDSEYSQFIEALRGLKPVMRSISWVLITALGKLALSAPSLLVKHKVLRRLVVSYLVEKGRYFKYEIKNK